MLDPACWPADFGDVPCFGEEEVRQLSSRFSINPMEMAVGFRHFKAMAGNSDSTYHVQPLLDILMTVPISRPTGTADCERGFSKMNTILTTKRSSMSVENLSSLMFISLTGPPTRLFNPTSYRYVKSWLQSGLHSAQDSGVKRRKQNEGCELYRHIWDSLF